MGSIALDETVGCTNPQVTFVFQRNGKLLDVASLKRSVFEITATAENERIAESALDLSDCGTGVRISKGVYHADFTADSGADFEIGTHEVRWKFKETGTSPEIEVRQRFEVLDKAKFHRGATYVGYADSVELRKFSPFDTKTIGEVQALTNTASRKIELLTGRFFEPRFQVRRMDGKGTRGFAFGDPIIGIGKVEIETGITGVDVSLTEIELDGLRVYNRHLEGLYDPDDRDDPRVEIERFEGILFHSLDIFPESPQGVFFTGVFGYTDADGGPFGKTPGDLLKVVGALARRELQDPFGSDPFSSSPGAVKRAKTRDQEIEFFGVGQTGGFGALTGDPFIDAILIPLVRPPHYAAV